MSKLRDDITVDFYRQADRQFLKIGKQHNGAVLEETVELTDLLAPSIAKLEQAIFEVEHKDDNKT